MTEPYYFIFLAGYIVLSALTFFLKDKKRELVINVFMVFATVFVAISLNNAIVARSKTSNSAMQQADKAELMLKFSSGMSSMSRYSPVKDQASVKQFYDSAEQALAGAQQVEPQSVTIQARKAILYAESSRGKKAVSKEIAAFDKMNFDKFSPAEKAEKIDRSKALSELLTRVYITQKVAPEEYDHLKQIADKKMLPGWYQEVIKIQLEKAAGHKKQYEKMVADFQEHYLYYVIKMAVAIVLGILAALIGSIVILAQLFFLPRSPTKDAEKELIAAPGKWSYKTVFAVFLGWLSWEFLLQPFVKQAINLGAISEQGSLAVACATGGLYLLQNAPPLVLIWLFAFKPHGVKFLEGIRFRTKIGKMGIFKLIFSGIGTWFAGVPIVICATIFAVLVFKFQGSDNPIVSVVMTAAKDPNPIGAVVFMFALGVLPALCEETLFRGFLYTSLRRNLGAFPSMVLSAAVFSAAHLDLGGALQLFSLGFIFAYVFERTKSLLPSMIAHCMWNSIMFLMALTFLG